MDYINCSTIAEAIQDFEGQTIYLVIGKACFSINRDLASDFFTRARKSEEARYTWNIVKKERAEKTRVVTRKNKRSPTGHNKWVELHSSVLAD